MAMVFSRDVVFIDVPETGGNAITRFLLESLQRPVSYASRIPYRVSNSTGLIHIHSHPHQTLAEARSILTSRGIDITTVPLILAVVRNPYDLIVSHFASRRKRLAEVTLLDEGDALRPPRHRERHDDELTSALAALTPGKVIRIEPGRGESVSDLRAALHLAALQLGRPIDSWHHDGIIYVAPDPPPPKPPRVRLPAPEGDFSTFIRQMRQRGTHSILHTLPQFYYLDGVMPPNLRLIRFERLLDDLRTTLGDVGADGDFEVLPRGLVQQDFAAFYDAETEALVYEWARWLFDQGLYERLDRITL